MDYYKLKELMHNKPTLKWDQADVEKWLSFIQLPQLIDVFKKESIDGSCIMLLEENDLQTVLNIQSVIIRKKLLNWIHNGLQEYNSMIDKQDNQPINSQQIAMFQANQRPKTQEMLSYTNIDVIEDNDQIPIQHQIMEIDHSDQHQQQQPQEQQPQEQQEQQQQQQQYQLLIQPTEYINSSLYQLDQKGGRIGRHSCNQMVVLEESVSRYHAEIVFNEGHFMIKDIGSTTGTFLKIQNQYQLEQDMIIEMGSNQFKIKYEGEQVLVLKVVEGPSQGEVTRIDGLQMTSFTIGRKEQNNHMSYPDDQHLSNTHARIYMIGCRWVIEDLSSTNGTWRRLSPEQNTSELFELENKAIFKVGSSSTFICEIQNIRVQKEQIVEEKNNELLCIICVENDRDAIYMPCRHNAACIKCTKQLKNCPICKVEIKEAIRIYRV